MWSRANRPTARTGTARPISRKLSQALSKLRCGLSDCEPLTLLKPADRSDLRTRGDHRLRAQIRVVHKQLTPAITGGKHMRAKGALVFDVRVDGVVRHSGARSRAARTETLE